MRAVRRLAVLVAVFVVGAVTASTQSRGVMADLAKDIAEVETKIVGLANAMPEPAWDWRPGPGVRSVGEVFTHVAADNYFMPAALGTATPKDVAISGTDYKTVGVYERTQALAGRDRRRGAKIVRLPEDGDDRRAGRHARRADEGLRHRDDSPGHLDRHDDAPARAPRTVDRLRAQQQDRAAVEQVAGSPRR